MQARPTASQDLPLKVEKTTRKDPATGLEVAVTKLKRGILARETRTYGPHNIPAMQTPTPLEVLNDLLQHLRQVLEEDGLPSDQTPQWIRKPGEEWKPFDPSREKIETFSQYCLWIKRVEQLAGLLSRNHRAAELLWSANALLALPDIEKYLWHILRFADDCHYYQISGNINRLATAALACSKGRVAGHKSLRSRSKLVREIVGRHVSRQWEARPAYRGNASKTAEIIVQAVNAELRECMLLRRNSDGMRVKTLTDHIRMLIKDKSLQTAW